MKALQFNIWSVIILVGVVQAFFLIIILVTLKRKNSANKWLAGLILAVTINLIEYAMSITGLTLKYPHSIAVSYPWLFCMGPFYLLFIKNQLYEAFYFKRKQLLHFIIPLACLLLLLPFYMTSAQEKIIFILNINKNGVTEIPAGQFVFIIAHMIQTSIYVYLSFIVIKKVHTRFKSTNSNTALHIKIAFLRKFTLYFLAWLLMYLLLIVLLFFISSYRIEIDYVSLLITSLLLFVIAYAVIQNPALFEEMIPQESIRKTAPPVKYKHSSLTSETLHRIKLALEDYFKHEKPYLEYNINLSDVAGTIAVTPQQLSQVINGEFNQNFFDFVNSYRIDEAKRLLSTPENNNLKILAIAFEVGFNSKATFYRVFKKRTLLTPTAYRKKFSDTR